MNDTLTEVSTISLMPQRRINVTILSSLLTALAILGKGLPLAQAVTTVGIVAVTGAFVSRHLTLTIESRLLRSVLASAMGLFVVLAVGLLMGAILPLLGISHPLDRLPVVIVWLAILGAIAWQSWRRSIDPLFELIGRVRRADLLWASVLSVPPMVALIGVTRLNTANQSTIAVACGILVTLMVVLAVAAPWKGSGIPRIALLSSALLTATWQVPLRGNWLAGWDIQHEWSVASLSVHQSVFPLSVPKGFYTDPYNGMLSLTVWPTQLHSLTGMNLRTILAIVPSLFLVLTLLAVWCAVRSWVGERTSAILCTIFVMGSQELLRYFPSVTRQCYAIFFFAVLVLAVTSPRISVKSARILIVMSGVGIAVTHYTTAYLTTGALVIGWLFAVVYRSPRRSRVVTFPVMAVVAASSVIWGSFVAKTGTSFTQILQSIRADGLSLLPASGSIVTRWLKGASISQLVNAKLIRAQDLHLRHTRFSSFPVDVRANSIPLVNHPAPSSSGVAVLGPAFNLSGVILAELLVGAAAVSILMLLVWSRRDRSLAVIAGMGVFGLAISLLSRLSQTLAVYFDPARVQLQMYLLFVVTSAIVAARLGPRLFQRIGPGLPSRARSGVIIVATLVCAVAISEATLLTNLAEHGTVLPAVYSTKGEALQRIPTPQDLVAAKWMSENRPYYLGVQSDIYGQLALFDYGYANRPSFYYSLDPVIVSDAAWLFAYHANIVDQRGRGGNNAKVGVFTFPIRYFTSTRSILWVSNSDVIFGMNAQYVTQLP